MAGARDHMRNETIRKRRLQAQRNRDASEEEQARQGELPGGHYTQEEKMLSGRPYENKAATLPDPDPEPEPEDPTLEVAFASSAASELAESEGLSPDDFEGVVPTGATGYTTGDVRAILKARADLSV